jgi:predicted transcriptional regulator
MARRNILQVVEDIIHLLKKEEDLSVKRISFRVKSQWETTIKALEFMERINLVTERKGHKSHKEERLFRLSKGYAPLVH